MGNCFAARQTTKTIDTAYLHSYDSGTHTCIIYDGLGCSGNASTFMKVVGKPFSQPSLCSLLKVAGIIVIVM